MFDRFLIRPDSLRNETVDGNVVGFTLAVRNANYRGVYLSLHNGYFIEVDGTSYPVSAQTFEINGAPPRTFEEIRTQVHEHWDYDDEGILHVAAPGGLGEGEHTIRFQQSVLAAYGYLPTDEEWVKNPPVPGTGAGSEKAPDIMTYTLPLTVEGRPEAGVATPATTAAPTGMSVSGGGPRATQASAATTDTAREPFRRGVSLYSYQQSQFFKQLSLEDQIREVGTNLGGADGIELIDEMSLRYPDPGEEFVTRWFSWMDTYGTRPVAMDVGMDVLQFRDHVMNIEECADRLRHDIRLAKRLGFTNVRTLSVAPLEVLLAALPLAEELDIRLGREIHQPMPLEGPQVTEIADYVERTGTQHLGIVPDLGIFQYKPSRVQLAWFERRGAQATATAAATSLAESLAADAGPFPRVDMSRHTAGNLRVDFAGFLRTGDIGAPDLRDAFQGVKDYTDAHVASPQPIDYTVVGEALMFSNTSADTLRELAPIVTHVHGKFNDMSEVAGRPGEYEEATIDYPAAIGGLVEGGFTGYINSEYEGQRYFQDRGIADLENEVKQVRRHQGMLRRLATA